MPKVEHIGDATLYLGDCLEILPMLGPVDAVVTDPPYSEDWSFILSRLELITNRIVVTPGKLQAFKWIRLKIPDWEYGWQSNTQSLGGSACLHIGFEPILAYGFPHRPLGTDLLQYPIGNEKDAGNFSWPKPISLIKKLISHWTNENEICLDPFMGSGTTGVACMFLKREFIGIEIKPDHFDIACRRIRDAYAQLRLPLKEPTPEKQGELLA